MKRMALLVLMVCAVLVAIVPVNGTARSGSEAGLVIAAVVPGAGAVGTSNTQAQVAVGEAAIGTSSSASYRLAAGTPLSAPSRTLHLPLLLRNQ